VRGLAARQRDALFSTYFSERLQPRLEFFLDESFGVLSSFLLRQQFGADRSQVGFQLVHPGMRVLARLGRSLALRNGVGEVDLVELLAHIPQRALEALGRLLVACVVGPEQVQAGRLVAPQGRAFLGQEVAGRGGCHGGVVARPS
jgi:hypothetical protein